MITEQAVSDLAGRVATLGHHLITAGNAIRDAGVQVYQAEARAQAAQIASVAVQAVAQAAVGAARAAPPFGQSEAAGKTSNFQWDSHQLERHCIYVRSIRRDKRLMVHACCRC